MKMTMRMRMSELGFITKDEGVVCSDDDGDENDNSRSEDED